MLDGKRVAPNTPGAKRVKDKAVMWYGQGIPGYPPKKRFPLASDKTAAKRMLEEMVRKAEQGQAGLPDRDSTRKTLKQLLDGFEAEVALGLGTKGGRKRKAPKPQHVQAVVAYVCDMLDGCGFSHPLELNDAAPAKLAKYLQDRVKKPVKDGGASPQTAEFQLSACRRFVRWIAPKTGVRADLFDGLPGFDPKSDRRHARRELPPEEVARVLDAAKSSPKTIRGLSGPDRYHLYLTAFATGYRSGELSELHPENFNLSAEPPTVTLPGRFTKNGKPAIQPLPPGVAALLREYLTGKPAGRSVWPGTWVERSAQMLRKDLAKAGVPYKVETTDGPRYADFHALRHSYLSALSALGVAPKELQELARHSDVRLTLGIYTHTRIGALGASVAKLNVPGVNETNPLARMSRAELEAAVVALAVALRTVVLDPAYTLRTPRRTPPMGISGDCTGLPEINERGMVAKMK